MLDARVSRLEDQMSEIRSALVSIKADLVHAPKTSDLTAIRGDIGSIRADVARLDGQLSQLPTILQLVGIVITTWSAGAAIVFTLLRFAKP